MHVVLRPFGYHPDGFTREALVPGDERDFGSSAAGLKAEGYIGEIKVAAQAATRALPAVEAPIVSAEVEIAPAALPAAEELDFADGSAESVTEAVEKPRRGRRPRQG